MPFAPLLAAAHSELIGLTVIIVLGIGAQWVAWRLRVPSILILLLTGFAIGPGAAIVSDAFGGDGQPWLRPDDLMGDLLLPLVAISLAVILFEGGLTLRLSELKQAGSTIINLCTTGAIVTWVLAGGFAYVLLGQGWALAVILGAMLTVTGPTVVGPLLQHIRPAPKVNAIGKWEGIVIDPVGATLGVLAFVAIEAIHTQGFGPATGQAALGLLRTVLVGGVIGAAGAVPIVLLLRNYQIPDYLQSPVLLAMVVACYTASNLLSDEAGLFAVTLMGLLIANQRFVSIQHLVEFKENLRVMLISWLFIVLAARLQVEQVALLGNWRSLAFVAMLMLVVRPAAVFASSWRSDLTLQEKLFLCWLAPRGIVAAALASIFTLRLESLNLPVVPEGAAEQLVPITFLVIVSTVAIYGLTAAPVARWLGVAQPDPQGILIASCHPGARAIGHAFKDAGFRVLMVDSNPFNVQAARMEGLSTVYASILSEHAIEEINLGGIGRFLALTRNDEVNSLATLRFREIFGRAGVYQLAPNEGRTREKTSHELIRGRQLFTADATYNELDARFSAGAVVKATKLSKAFTYDDFQKLYGGEALLLFVVGETGALSINTVGQPMNPKPGDTVVCLVDRVVERADEEPAAETAEK